MSCYNCACNRCVYNAELDLQCFTPGEIQDVEDICYCCDECRNYDGDTRKRSLWRPECEKRKIPRKYEEQMANARRRRFVVIKGDLSG